MTASEMQTTRPGFRGVWIGRRRYEPVLELQRKLHAARRDGLVPDTILYVEHEPVITMGRGAKAEHLLQSAQTLEQLGVDLVEIRRGGDVTLHAPGQLVAYPIIDLAPDRKDVRRYVQDLTRVMSSVVTEYGLSTGTLDEHIGLWADAECPSAWPGEASAGTPVKLGAIGVHISRWVTMHGFALNLTTDLALFGLIVPCGIREHGVSTVAALSGRSPGVEEAAGHAHRAFARVFGTSVNDSALELVDWSREPLGALQPAFEIAG